MKKKIFALITAVALVAILCLSLVACDDNENNDGNDLSPITFSDNMSKDEIMEQLDKVENCTIELLRNGETLSVNYVGSNYSCSKYAYYYSYGKVEDTFWEFIEGNRVYLFMYSGDTGEVEKKIIDYSGYDVDLSGLNDLLEQYMDYIKDNVVVVENGNLKIEIAYSEDGETQTDTYILRDFNTTKMPTVPEEFKDYKNMDATSDVIEFELSDDGAYYTLEDIDFLVKSYEVPATYNGKPVTRFEESCSSANLKTLTLPTSITYLRSYCHHDVEDGELHIIYKGTKAQWEAIENSNVWSTTEGVRITCSDGDYVVAPQE